MTYEQRQEDRRDRLSAAAKRASAESTAALDLARQRASVIPTGQPMLTDHYSYKGDRSFRDKIHNGYAKGFELHDKAEHYADAAASVGTAGIASDNPDAPNQLAIKLAQLEVHQAAMKVARKITLATVKRHGLSRWNGDGVTPEIRAEFHAALQAAKLPETVIAGVTHVGYGGQPLGVQDYELTNLGAKIRTTKKRLTELATHDLDDGPSIDGDGWRVRTEDGRIMLAFDARLDKADWLAVKSAGGFTWSRTREAFVRVDTPNARHAVAYQASQNWGLNK